MAQLWDPLWEYVLEDYDEDKRKKERARQIAFQRGNQNRAGTSRASSNRTRQNYESESSPKSLNFMNFFEDEHEDTDDDDAVDESREWDRTWLDDGQDEREDDMGSKKTKGILRRSQSKESKASSTSSVWTPFVRSTSKSSMKKERSDISKSTSNNAQAANEESEIDVWEMFAGTARTPPEEKVQTRSILKKEKSKNGKSSNKAQTTKGSIDPWETFAGSTPQLERNGDQNPTRTGSKRGGLSKSLKKSKSDSSGRSTSKSSKNSSGSQRTKLLVARKEEYPLDSNDDIWDILTGTPPVATTRAIKRAPVGTTKSASGASRNKGRRFGIGKSNSEISGRSNEKRAERSDKRQGSNIGDQKRSVFKRPPRKAYNSENSSPTSPGAQTHTKQESTDQKAVMARSKEESKTNADVENSQAIAEFDPMLLLLEVAGRLDPWGGMDSSDSNSETSETESSSVMTCKETSETQSVGGEETHTPVDKMESLLDQPLPDPNTFDPRYAYQPAPHKAYSTEIRLKVNPGGQTVSEEIYKRSLTYDENSESEVDAHNSHAWEDSASKASPSFADASDSSIADLSKPRPSFGDITKWTIGEDTHGQTYDEETALLRSENAIKRNKFPSDEVRVPRDLHIKTKSIILEDDEGSFDVSENHMLWKRVVCCSVKNMKGSDLVNRFNRVDAADVFPATRMISNGRTHAITGQKADHVNGVMGVPSDRFFESEGPQSLYAYDYESNVHMDVQYGETNQRPRSSISVRNLGPPPSIAWDEVVIQVEASTVSETDCLIRQGQWWGERDAPLPNTPGVDVVGKVFHVKRTTETVHDLHPWQTVLSLVKWGGNSRYMSLSPNQLVKVPDGLDPAQVACLPETYLSAFQVLHTGQAGSRRYRENSLKGKSILIVGAMANNIGKAIIELALAGQAGNIYATAKKKDWKALISLGVMPLGQDASEWVQRFEGMIDLVLAPNGRLREDVTPVHFRALVPRQGQLILCGRRTVGNDIPIGEWKREQTTLACGRNRALSKILSKASAYDVYEEWQTNLELCKRDLSHLLGLLEHEMIKPVVLDRLPLDKVAKAHELLEAKSLPGFLVCEPWMRSKKRAVYL